MSTPLPLPNEAPPPAADRPAPRPLPLPEPTPAVTDSPARSTFVSPPSRMPTAAPHRPSAHRRIGAQRFDPYYDGIWTAATRGVLWASRKRTEQLRDAGLAGWLPRHLRVDPQDALERLDWAFEVKLRIIGALQAWRTLTAQQLAEITGVDTSGRTGRRVLAELYALDVLQAGFAWSPSPRPGRNAPEASVYRIAESGPLQRRFAPRMTYAESVAVTGGQRFATGSAERHDLLAAELALRLAEHPSTSGAIATVLSERFAALHDLAFLGAGFDVPPLVTNRHADLALVRADGLRIAVELQTSNTRALEAKLLAWARALAARSLDETGLVVLVLIAPGPDERGDARRIRHAVSAAVRAHPGTAQHRTADRMFVADWTDWFPASHAAAEAFAGLRAARLDLVSDPSNPTWSDVVLLDRVDVASPRRLPDPLAVVANAAGLVGTPRAFADRVPARDRPELAGVPVRDLGLEAVVAELAARPRHGHAVATASTPPRLRF